MTTFVLVHGGAHGAWCWERVVDRLETAGHRAVTVDLPGRGASSDTVTTATLDDWVATLSSAIDSAPQPPVVVAHSAAGISASQAAELRSADIARLVFVAAIVPQDGQTGLATMLGAGSECALAADGVMVLSHDGLVVSIPPEHAINMFYNTTEPNTAAAAIARMCPEAMIPLTTPLSLSDSFANVPKAYIGTKDDRVVPLEYGRHLATNCGADFTSIAGDHSPFYSAVDELIEQLLIHAG